MPDRYEELRALLAEATPGPWEAFFWDEEDHAVGGIVRAKRGAGEAWPFVLDITHNVDGPLATHASGNIALVAAAVNALPEILDEVERLRDRVEDLTVSFNGTAQLLRVEERETLRLTAEKEQLQHTVERNQVAIELLQRGLDPRVSLLTEALRQVRDITGNPKIQRIIDAALSSPSEVSQHEGRTDD